MSQELLDLIIIEKPDWTSRSWTELWSFIFKTSQRSYKSAKQWYVSFCVGSGVDPMPTSEQKLCRYVSFLAQEGLAPSSIKLYLPAVRHL